MIDFDLLKTLASLWHAAGIMQNAITDKTTNVNSSSYITNRIWVQFFHANCKNENVVTNFLTRALNQKYLFLFLLLQIFQKKSCVRDVLKILLCQNYHQEKKEEETQKVRTKFFFSSVKDEGYFFFPHSKTSTSFHTKRTFAI